MSSSLSLGLLSLPSAVQPLRRPALADAVGYYDPHATIIPDAAAAPERYALARDVVGAGHPLLHPQLGRPGERIHHVRHTEAGTAPAADFDSDPLDRAIDLVAVQDSQVVADLTAEFEAGARRVAPGAATFVAVPDLTVEMDRPTLTATLPTADELVALRQAVDSPVTVLAGELPADYHHDWAFEGDGTPVETDLAASDGASETRIPVHGLGAVDGYSSQKKLSRLTLTAAGAAAAEPLAAMKFGLRAVNGIGAKTAERLAQQGVTTRDGLAAMAHDDLTSVAGIGEQSAATIAQHAEVLRTQTPVRLTSDRLPVRRNDRPPLCLDIETDGLSPTVVWQVGIYDPESDDYRSFVEDENPDDPGGIIEAFTAWLVGNHADRTIITWNGYGFDYPVLERFIDRHAPHFAEPWADLWKYDLYKWAVRDDNALLPGRTNRLGAVADALGYDGADTGLSGAQTAAAYQEFMRTGDSSVLDWERHRRYCEDDSRALAHVWTALETAERVRPGDASAQGGTQTGLGEF